MAVLSLGAVAAVTGGTVVSGSPSLEVDRYAIDSRRIRGGELFFALIGERIRGIVAAVRAGRFAANPVEEEDSCKFCDFSQLCRHAAGERAAEGGKDE